MHSPRSLFGFDFVAFERGEQKPPVQRARDKLAGTWEVERGKFYDPVRSLLKSKNQDINRLQLAVRLPWAIFFESVDILS
ncbi:hypothetical protein TNCV_4207531 [Trichonephila clavipes]|nr:hypothetical protein TNCV_4207531 [Trichonephila clavipes]